MNTTAQFGAMLCPLLVAYSLKWYANWDITIYTMAALFLIGAVAWASLTRRSPFRKGYRQSEY